MGGLPRRATFIKGEEEEGIGTLIVDSGNFISSKPLAEKALEPAVQKAQLILEAMDEMGYAFMALGEMDLYLGIERLRDLDRSADVGFLSANLAYPGGKAISKPFRIVDTGGLKVGIIGLTAAPGKRKLFEKRNPGLTVTEPLDAAAKTVERIRDKCDLVVILSNIGFAKDLDLADTVPGIDVIISGGTKRFMKRPRVRNNTLVTSGYYEGRAVGRLTVHLDGVVRGWVAKHELDFIDSQIKVAEAKTGTPAGKRRYDDLAGKREALSAKTLYVPDMINLGPSFPDDPGIRMLIDQYGKTVSKNTGSPEAVPAVRARVRYTGAAACRECHRSRYRFWKNTGHASAFESLAPENAASDPACIPCHVTGYKRRTGYWPKAPKEFLRDVQCEACHGVGSLHVVDPDSHSLLHRPLAPRCLDCHTKEQDKDFDYSRDRWMVCAEM